VTGAATGAGGTGGAAEGGVGPLLVGRSDDSARAALGPGAAMEAAAADTGALIPPSREVCPADIRPRARSPEGPVGEVETECFFRAERSSSMAIREERGVKGLLGTAERSAAQS
jgi:hypothetical protein